MERKARRAVNHGTALVAHMIAGVVCGPIAFFVYLLISQSIFLINQIRYAQGFSIVRYNFNVNGFNYFLPDLDRAEAGILFYAAPFFGAALGAVVFLLRKCKTTNSQP